MTPFFSIVIPCCDVEPYVRECLDSVLRQPFADWEALVGVETSKDKTEEIVREYAARDGRFTVFTGPRSGSCSASRNTGIDMATGEYVIFLDGDDTIAEGSLQRLHDKIAARPGADLYPCAMLVRNEITRRDEPVRDNYPPTAPVELTGPEATILTMRHIQNPCPMLQLTVFRHAFLQSNNLRCIYGLRHQDSEFSPRALYMARRVVPLHYAFYIYRIRTQSVQTSAEGNGYFLGDWATILRSLLAFHAQVRKHPEFDNHIADCWARQWISWLLGTWFSAYSIKRISRDIRRKTLSALFQNGFEDLNAIQNSVPLSRRIALYHAKLFVRNRSLAGFAEWFFMIYDRLSSLKNCIGRHR